MPLNIKRRYTWAGQFSAGANNVSEDGLPCTGVAPQYIKAATENKLTCKDTFNFSEHLHRLLFIQSDLHCNSKDILLRRFDAVIY